MLALLSPAKTLDLTSRPPTRKHTEPRLLDESRRLIDVLITRSPDELASLMGISEDLAHLNAQRYRDFDVPFTPQCFDPAGAVALEHRFPATLHFVHLAGDQGTRCCTAGIGLRQRYRRPARLPSDQGGDTACTVGVVAGGSDEVLVGWRVLQEHEFPAT